MKKISYFENLICSLKNVESFLRNMCKISEIKNLYNILRSHHK